MGDSKAIRQRMQCLSFVRFRAERQRELEQIGFGRTDAMLLAYNEARGRARLSLTVGIRPALDAGIAVLRNGDGSRSFAFVGQPNVTAAA